MRKLICYCLLACVFFTGCTKDKKKELSKSAVKEQPQLNLAKEEKKSLKIFSMFLSIQMVFHARSKKKL